MILPDLSRFRLTEPYWRGIILLLSGAVILFTIWCLSNGITTIFMHLYYFPIVLLAYHYRRKGFGLAMLLALAYLGLVMVFDAGQTEVIVGAFYRVLVFVGIAAVITYLSERLAKETRSAQEAAELRERYISLAPAIILVLDRNGIITYLNPKGGEILEYTPREVTGKSWFDQFLPDHDRDRVKQLFSKLVAGQVQPDRAFENPVLTRGGTEKIIRWHNTVLHDDSGGISGILGFGEDITGENRVRDSLRKMQQFQESVIANANVWISVLAPDGSTILVWNDAAEAISGYKKSNVVGNNTVWKQLYPDKDYRRKVTGDIRRIIGKDQFLENFETEIHCADGTKKSLVWNTRAIRDTQGRIISYIAIGRDITDQKRAEDELRQNRFLLSEAMDLAHLASWELDVLTGIFTFDDRFYAMYGTTAGREGGYRMPVEVYAREFVHPDDAAVVGEEINKAIQTADPGFVNQVEHRIIRRDGKVRTIIVRHTVTKDNEGRTIKTHGANQDITDRKSIEEKLRESEEKFREIFSNINDAVQIHDIEPDGRPGKFLDVNDAACRMLMVSRDEILAHSPLDYATEYHNPTLEEVVRQLHAKGTATFETGHRRTDGVVVPVEINAHVIELMGKTVVLSVIRDITERKKAEDNIRLSNVILSTQQETSPDGILIVDESGKILSFNRKFKEIWGIPQDIIDSRSDEQALTFVLGKLTDPQEFLSRVKYLYEHREEKSHEEIQLKDGRVLERYSDPMIGENNRYFGRVWYFHDITQRKQAEESIRESRQLFSDIISFLPDPTFVIDGDGKVLAWNRALEQFSGVPAGDIIGKGDHEYSLWVYGKRRPILIDLVLHPDEDAGRLDYTGIHWEGRTITAQTEIIRPGMGHKITLSLVASPLIDAQGKVTGAIESMRDISRLKEAEAELARINQNLEQIVRDRTRALEDEVVQRIHAEKDVQAALSYTRSVIEANPDLMVVLDGKGTVLDVNATAEMLTGISRDQLIGTRYFGFLVDDGTHTDAFSRLLEQGRIEKIIQVVHKDGHITPLSINATMISAGDGTGVRIIVAGHDITRQKEDEAAIQASLDEKVILLREVHHRVKNNLQIIISLVNLQMRQTNDPGVKQIMAETQNRVRAMSLVHEKLYRSESLSRIDFADYTRFLATQLFSFYGTDTRRVRLDLAMGKIMVDINTAVPLGLLMNELISNALKHAFPNGREGTINISGSEENNLITLVVRDDGIGIPKGLDWKNTTSLGMRLVTSLIDQVDGTITLDHSAGTAFSIVLKKKN